MPVPLAENARHLRLLARMSEIQMEVIEATRTEAVEAPHPGVTIASGLPSSRTGRI